MILIFEKFVSFKRAVQIAALLAVGLLPVTLISAQVPAKGVTNAGGRVIKWKMLGGKDNEFFFAIPETSVVYSSGNFALHPDGYSRVDSLKTMVCRVNNTVLQISLYEGAAKEIQKRLLSNLKKEDSRTTDLSEVDADNKSERKPAAQIEIKDSQINGFDVSDVAFRAKNHTVKIQMFRSKSRLYFVKSVARSQNDQIARDFFESIKLVSGDTVVTPNLNNKSEPAAAAKMLLPKAVIETAEQSGGSNAAIIEPNDADKKMVLVYFPKPASPPSDTRFDRGFYQLKLKVLFQADGKIGTVETITKTSKEIEKQAIEAAKEIVFLPAEKDGKPVSTYGTVQYSLAFIY
jgi:hypothetical protein